jgi:hypothetical protein
MSSSMEASLIYNFVIPKIQICCSPKLGLELNNCGRTTKNDHHCIYSLRVNHLSHCTTDAQPVARKWSVFVFSSLKLQTQRQCYCNSLGGLSKTNLDPGWFLNSTTACNSLNRMQVFLGGFISFSVMPLRLDFFGWCGCGYCKSNSYSAFTACWRTTFFLPGSPHRSFSWWQDPLFS